MNRLLILACCCLMAVSSFGQQALGQRPRVKSPVINQDGTVTFNFYDPTAQQVSVNGDFEEIRNRRLDMTKQENGVWTVTTTAPLAPELYSYSLSVDGQRLIDPANSYVNRDIATLSNIFIVSKAADDKGHLYQVNDVPHGTLSRVWYDSPTLGQQRRMTVYLPPSYDGKKKFPVMYLLHGHGGDETAWGDLGRTSQIMDNLIAEGKCVPMIVVMPNGNPTCNAAPGWWHEGMYTPDGNAFNQRGAKATMEESFMDIVNFVDSHYMTIKQRSGRAVTGLSMGGGHTFEHELACAVDAGMLGSIDANRGDAQNGWDTDQFPIDNFELTQAMLEIIRNGGLGNGGTNFDAKIRRNSTDLEDLFIAHISGMDAMARALMNAADILENSELPAMKKARYASFDGGIGKDFEDGKLTFEQVYEYGKKVEEPKQTSGKQEKYETIVALYAK